MRLYGRKFAKQFVNKQVASRDETRDAILWDIDTVNNIARVKIQGSNELVIAHYPRNWKAIPYWLKPGGAVRIIHRSGVRGYVELAGEGRAIPTAVTGASTPTTGTGADGIIATDATGTYLSISETDPESMAVLIYGGTYRINNTVYDTNPPPLDYITMSNPAPMVMGCGTVMGSKALKIQINTAPSAGNFRYDLICVGIDNIIDYIAGTASSTPVKPSVPADHIAINYILVQGSVTEIYDHDVGAIWVAPVPTTLNIVLGDAEFAWDAGDDYPETTIAVTVKDQYGNTISASPDQYTITLTKSYGTGQVYSSDSGWDNDTVSQPCYSNYTFKYKRDQTTTEHSPTFTITLELDVPFNNIINIILLDVSGDPIG